MARPTKKQLINALWQAYYHNELDALYEQFYKIDGNDHPVLEKAAEGILRRWNDA